MSGVTSSNVGLSKKKPGAPADLNPLSPSIIRSLDSGPINRAKVLLVFSLLYLAASVFPVDAQSPLLPSPKPLDAPDDWKAFVGDYGSETNDAYTFLVVERNGELFLVRKSGGESRLDRIGPDGFTVSSPLIPRTANPPLHRDSHGAVALQVGAVAFLRRDYIWQSDHVYKIHPLHPIEELRKAALTDSPPHESATFRNSDLLEVATLDSAIHLDIRYATANDFLGTPVYSQARAFLQRPAAEALVRALHKLHPFGYGLLIHDGYRPWYVTKIFWDATPAEGKIFVADPVQGSRHNRGCAVDLTLYNLATGKPIEMPGTYDEMSPRSFPNYPGGTSLQRWHRDLLRLAMESEGFTVYESEWWHFDYKDWHEYEILNVPFEKLNIGSPQK